MFSLLLPFLEVILQTVINTLRSREDQTNKVKAFDTAFVRNTGQKTSGADLKEMPEGFRSPLAQNPLAVPKGSRGT